MQNKPVIFFISLMTLALILVITYQLKTNPFDQSALSRKSVAESPHPQDNSIALFTQYCANCHGSFGEGRGINPSLKGTKLAHDQIAQLIRNGKGEMPAFNKLTDEQVHQLVTLVEKL